MVSTGSVVSSDPREGRSGALLDPEKPGAWGEIPSDVLFAMPQDEVEAAQLEALALRFARMRPQVGALHQLARRQGVEAIESFASAPAVFFDQRVYKSYPVTLIEQRRFDRMTTWLQRLTTCDLSNVDTDGLTSVDAWLDRLGEHGLSVGHTTGTSGKLSFLPRSEADWPGYSAAIYEMQRGMFGFDPRTVGLPYFSPAYRRAHYSIGALLKKRLAEDQVPTDRYFAHPVPISVDLISLAGKLQAAETSGQLDKLKFEVELLAQRDALIAQSGNRDQEVADWLQNLASHRGQRVFLQGTGADLYRAMLRGKELGIEIAVAPDSILMTGGGMKGYPDASANWEDQVCEYFGIERIFSTYGMSECLGAAGACAEGFYHVPPYLLPIILDESYEALPRRGVQTGRFAFFDFLAETEWGGFITDDQVTVHWDDACTCGRGGPRFDKRIQRISEVSGADEDKISCAGIAEAYDSFMDFVSTI